MNPKENEARQSRVDEQREQRRRFPVYGNWEEERGFGQQISASSAPQPMQFDLHLASIEQE
jgi:hypothetical protein